MKDIILLAILILAMLSIGPFLTLWSLNTLFPALAIPYTWHTWAACVILFAGVKGNSGSSKN